MIDKVIKLWYSIPKVHFRNPFRLEKRDKREFDWFKERKKFGFDERELWNLGYNLSKRIEKLFGDKDFDLDEDISILRFGDWFYYDVNEIKWLLDRVDKYIEWDCPTFYIDNESGNYDQLPEDKQRDIMLKIRDILQFRIDDGKNGIYLMKEEDVRFVYDHIFQLGW